MSDKIFLVFEADGRRLKIEATVNHSPYGGPVAVPFSIVHEPYDDPEFMGSINVFPKAAETNGILDPLKRYKITVEEVQSFDTTVREKK